MSKFSELTPEEQKFLISLGLDFLRFAGKSFKTLNAKGVDLVKLMNKARADNTISIDDLIVGEGEENG